LSAEASGSGIRTDVLEGGLRLVTESMADVHSVAVGFWVGTGSRDEPEELAGASHFLEHLLFKGTEERSAAAIAEALDEVGGDCNAFTTKEYTAFYVRLLARDLPLGLDILTDILRAPALRARDLDAERSVILDEILMHGDEPSDLVGERWQAAHFPHHGLGRDTLGSAATVGTLGPPEIRAFFEHHYRPGNMVVAAAGAVDHEALAEAIARRFGGAGGGSRPLREAPVEVPEALSVVHRPTEQAHLVFGARSVPLSDERRWAWAVLNHTLGGGLSSRLFQKVREQRGLAYSVWSERAGYADAGTLCVSVGTAPEYVDEVLGIVLAELEDLAEHGVSARELAIAKGNLAAEVLLAGEDSGARMSRVGAALLLHGTVLTTAEILEHVEAVGLEDVREAATALATAPRTLAAVGPFDADAFSELAATVAGIES
jgi:predicted Zn-dependent peptidase